jgi:hypothetical protein
MFIGGSDRGYLRDGTQVALGAFLILFSRRGWVVKDPRAKTGEYDEIRGVVRRVKLTQTGHWMMGQADLWGHTVTLSGTYGEDGLTNDLRAHDEEIWDWLHPLPPELIHEFWTDGTGWNSAGVHSGPKVHDWAKNRLDQLRRKYTSLKAHECAYCGIPSVYVSQPRYRWPTRTDAQRFCADCRDRGPIPAVLAI